MTKNDYLHAGIVWSIFGTIAFISSLYFIIFAKEVDINEDIEQISGVISNFPKLKNAGGKTFSQVLEISLEGNSRIYRLQGVALSELDSNINLLKHNQLITISCFKVGHETIGSSSNNNFSSIWGLRINDKIILDEKELIVVNADLYNGIGLLFAVSVCSFIAYASFKSYKSS
jgi:hypothetical protein